MDRRDAIFEIFPGVEVEGPIGCCVPIPRPDENAGVLGAPGGRDPRSKSKFSSLMICNEGSSASDKKFVAVLFDVSDNELCIVNKMSDEKSDFCCVLALSTFNLYEVAQAVGVFVYGDFPRSKSRT